MNLLANEKITLWIAPIAILIAGYALFMVLRPWIFRRLTNWTQKTENKLDDNLLNGLKGPSHLLAIVAITSLALQTVPGEFRSHLGIVLGVKLGLIVSLLWMIDRIGTVFVRSGKLVKVGDSNRRIIQIIFRFFVFSITGLIVLDTLGISITPLLASLGVGSVAVALALQDTLGNFFGGIYLLMDKPIRIGDYVSIDDVVIGHVTKIGWRSTRIQLLSNNTVIIPNSKLVNSRITNFDYPDRELEIDIPLQVSVGSDLQKVEVVAIEVAREILSKVDGGVSSTEPILRFKDLAQTAVKFDVYLRVRQFVDQYRVRHEFIKALHSRFIKEGITTH